MDAWTTSDGITLCLKGDGRVCTEDIRHRTTFYARTAHPERLERLLGRTPGVSVSRGSIRNLFGRDMDVLAVTAPPTRVRRTVRAVEYCMGGEPELFNADIEPVQEFLVRRGIFPTCELDGRLRTDDDPWKVDLDLPPIRAMTIEPARNWRWEGVDTMTVNGKTSGIEDLAGMLEDDDPDVLVVPEGDEFLPMLEERAGDRGVRLALDRVHARRRSLEGRVLHSYGRPVYRPGEFLLRGRILIPGGFTYGEADLEGVIELARIAHMSIQRTARISPGTVISALQVNHLLRSGIPVPWHKNMPESVKTIRELLLADRGGFIFTPIPGVYENVHELDFTAMYPSIMVKHNISPETLFIEGRRYDIVPELDYRISTDVRGVIPVVLEPLIARREALKERGDERSKMRASALKWLLVTCFGYTGYRNAKLGRIEAHEAINAFGREYMLRAKETAERLGCRVIHGIVDSLWVQGGGSIEDLVEGINVATGLNIRHEADFKWIVFLPVKSGMRGTLNHYFGLQTDGEIKVRGIAMRRRDSPPIVCRTQMLGLERLDAFYNGGKAMEHVLKPFVRACRRLKDGTASPDEVVIRRLVSKELEEYMRETPSKQAQQALADRGVMLRPGQKIEYVIGWDGNAVLPGEGAYGAEHYIKLLEESAVEVLQMFTGGADEVREALRKQVGYVMMENKVVLPGTGGHRSLAVG